MSLSAYDLWKTTVPAERRREGDCQECGHETQWIAGSELALLQAAAGLRSGTSLPLVKEKPFAGGRICLDPDELYCAHCGSEALRARFDPCICGAETAWQCVCP